MRNAATIIALLTAVAPILGADVPGLVPSTPFESGRIFADFDIMTDNKGERRIVFYGTAESNLGATNMFVRLRDFDTGKTNIFGNATFTAISSSSFRIDSLTLVLPTPTRDIFARLTTEALTYKPIWYQGYSTIHFDTIRFLPDTRFIVSIQPHSDSDTNGLPDFTDPITLRPTLRPLSPPALDGSVVFRAYPITLRTAFSLQASSDLKHWTTIHSGISVTNSIGVFVPKATGFYRLSMP